MRNRAIKTDPKVENVAVLYLRYSSDSQNEQSIEGQRRDCMDYCKRNGIRVLDEYIDRAKTGTNANRPGFQKMVDDSSYRRFGKVIVWKSDRFSRDRLDALKYKAILGNNGVKLISVQEPLIEGPEGIILESVLDSMNQYYSEELSVKVKRGMNENVIKGKTTGGLRQFGYKIVDGYYQIDEHEGPMVQEAFRLYADEGKSILAITKEFEKRGYRRSDGSKISHNTLEKALASERYIGVLKCSGQRNENAIPPLVSKELFDRAQAKRMKHKHKNYALRAKDEYILSGKIFCAKCGAPYLGESGTSKSGKLYSYYKCNGAKHHKCDAKQISKDVLENTIASAILLCLSDTKFAKEMAKHIASQQDRESTEVTSMKKRLAEVEKRISNFLNAIGMGIVTESTKAELMKLEDEKKTLEAEISKAQIKAPRYTVDEIWYALKEIARYGASDKQQVRSILNTFVIKVMVKEDGALEVMTNIFGMMKLEKDAQGVRINTALLRQFDTVRTHQHGFVAISYLPKRSKKSQK